jgi:hypothetical protein|tara:strand:- start:125 stop:346 length:222 start_codon:yes stop_codon:yes gene_type:complete
MKIEDNKVIDQYGAVLAEYIRGEWHTKDPAVLEFVMSEDKPEKKRVRARDEKGRLKADDPSTPNINEAWMPEA